MNSNLKNNDDIYWEGSEIRMNMLLHADPQKRKLFFLVYTALQLIHIKKILYLFQI